MGPNVEPEWFDTAPASMAESPALTADPPVIAASSGNSAAHELRIYRLAIATTAEYTNYRGGTVSDGLAAVETVVERLNEIYERELSIRFELVQNNASIIHTDSNPGPYTNPLDPSELASAAQTDIDNKIGDGNYDIGHVFSTASGGMSYIETVGMSGWKARGTSGGPTPVGDDFCLSVAHEIGHQFGAYHTWNGNDLSSQWHGDSAMEPGSGSTIMSYAGTMPGRLFSFPQYRADYPVH